MDVLNALLGAAVPLDDIILADPDSAAYFPFEGVRIIDAETLTVAWQDGSQPVLLHHILGKPWLTRHVPNPYSRLMTRLLFGEEIAMRVAARRVPPSLRPGPAGSVARSHAISRDWLAHARRGKLSSRDRVARTETSCGSREDGS